MHGQNHIKFSNRLMLIALYDLARLSCEST